ncbi:MAG: carboxypeptidase-like regulatory domain-containing protein [Pirellulales bacterium]
MMNLVNRGLAIVLVCLLGCIVGCGDGLKRVNIKGSIICDGKPVDNATVQLIPRDGTPGEGAIGQSDSSGTFSVISSRDQDVGLPPGNYTVRVSRLVNIDGKVLPAEATEAEYPDSFESIPSPFCSMASNIELKVSNQGGDVKLEIPGKLLTKKK